MRVDVYYRLYTQTEVHLVQNSILNGYHPDSVSEKRKGFLAIESFQIQNQFSIPDPTSEMIGVSSHSYQPCLFLALDQMLDSQTQCGREDFTTQGRKQEICQKTNNSTVQN